MRTRVRLPSPPNFRSGVFQLPVEVAAHPAEEQKRNGQHGGGRGDREGFGLPTLVDEVVEDNKGDGEQADHADQGAERHEDAAENSAFALARETDITLRESGHVRGAEGE